MRRICTFLVAFTLLSLFGQTGRTQDPFEDFFDSADPAFMKEKREAEERFKQILELDAEFAAILNRAWTELELSTGIVSDTEPKPRVIPSARPAEHPPVEKPSDMVPVGEPPPPPVTPETIAHLGTPVTFFRTTFPLRFSEAMRVRLGDAVSEGAISRYWEALSGTAYEDCLTQLLQVKSQLGLNDWGYCMLLDHVATTVYGEEAGERPLFIWFFLVKSGYDARVGFTGGEISVLLPSRTIVYNTPFYEVDGVRYYLTDLGTGSRMVKSLYTYQGSYAEAERNIDFAVNVIPDISKTLYEKPFSFSYDGREYGLSVRLNRNMVDFFQTYPQTSLDIYFTASVTSETAQSLLDGLRPALAGREEVDAVNLLLRFVQNGFPYRTDSEQFGSEKFMFPEETLSYSYSDCEDRSFLFAYLVSSLLGLDVIGLDYPGHVATAVKFSSPAEGDAVECDDMRYIICDPTYINADAGECMPSYRGVEPAIVRYQTGTGQ